MARAQTHRLRTMLSLSLLSVGDGVELEDGVPVAFRIFRNGTNESEKGAFLFDDQAAGLVLAQYQAHGKPMVLDYNHGTTFPEPTPDQAIAAGRFVPQVRADGLWATQCKWTPRALGYFAAGEYLMFSPYFESDKATGRVTRLINVALTNLPALDNLAPLVAANATTTEDLMADTCTACTALNTRLSAMDEECRALRAKLSAFEEKDKDKMSAVALRAQVLGMTGKASEAEALGVLTALSNSHAELVTLKGKLVEETTKRLSAEFGGLLDEAIAGKEPKITPAQRSYWEGLAKEDGLEKGVVRLRAFLGTATTLSVTGEHKQKPSNGPAIGPEQEHVNRLLRIEADKFQASEARRLSRGAQ